MWESEAVAMEEILESTGKKGVCAEMYSGEYSVRYYTMPNVSYYTSLTIVFLVKKRIPS